MLEANTFSWTIGQQPHSIGGSAVPQPSLETLLDTGSGKLLHASRFSHAKAEQQKLTKHERTVMQVASFLRHELPVRLAHRAHELRDLPHGLSDMPSISIVDYVL